MMENDTNQPMPLMPHKIDIILDGAPLTDTEYVVEGSPVELLCKLDDADVQAEGEDVVVPAWIYDGVYANKQAHLFKLDNNETHSTLVVPSFTHEHAGVYECSSRSKSGQKIRKQMHLKVAANTPVGASSSFAACPTTGPYAADYCLNGGECFMLDNVIGCKCPPDRAGKTCADPYQKYVPTLTASSSTGKCSTAGAAAVIPLLGVVIGFLILIIIALIYLYRQKKKCDRDPESPTTPLCAERAQQAFDFRIPPVTCAQVWTQISRERSNGAYANVSDCSIYHPTEMQSPTAINSTVGTHQTSTLLDQTTVANNNSRQRTESEKSYIFN